MATYYRQRSDAFMVTEGTQIEPGQGYAWTPGIHSPEQIQGWRKSTLFTPKGGDSLLNFGM